MSIRKDGSALLGVINPQPPFSRKCIMESVEMTQTVVAPQALAERLTQMEAVNPGENETDDDQPVTIRQRREAAMKGPFVEQIAQWFRGRGILLKRGEK